MCVAQFEVNQSWEPWFSGRRPKQPYDSNRRGALLMHVQERTTF